MRRVSKASPLIVLAGALAVITADASADRPPDRAVRGHTVVSTHDSRIEAAVVARAQRSMEFR